METARIRDGKKSDPGSGVNIPDPQHCSCHLLLETFWAVFFIHTGFIFGSGPADRVLRLLAPSLDLDPQKSDKHFSFASSSVPDPRHFELDPDPRIHASV